MLDVLLTRNVQELDSYEMELECRELEDAYAEALKDNAGFEALGEVWKRIRELQNRLKEHSAKR